MLAWQDWGEAVGGHVPLSVVVGVVAVALPIALWWASRGRRRGTPRRSGPLDDGLGAALALALDGDLSGASAAIKRATGQRGLTPQHVVAWVAVARAAGRSAEAAAAIERLAREQATTPRWVAALRLRLALDVDDVGGAAALADARPDLPADARVAAFARAGRWVDARRVWREHEGRRGDAAALACLEAGVAAERWAPEPPRAARRALKRALALEPSSIAGLVVAIEAAESKDEARRLRAQLNELLAKWGSPSGSSGIKSAQEVLNAAREAYEAGEVEAALGILRGHLDAHPRDDAVRRPYALWLCEHGEPADWRAELRAWAEEALPPPEQRFGCSRCGFVMGEPWLVCSRCDALAPAPVPVVLARKTPAAKSGARVTDLQALMARRKDGPAG